jgi:hypothetical protein
MAGVDQETYEKLYKEYLVLTMVDYQEGLKEGKLLGLKCNDCKQLTCPPMMVCCRCGSMDLEKAELKGEGELMTFTVIRVPPEGHDAPYIPCMVKTTEGPWVSGRLDHDPDNAPQDLCGKKVKMKGVYDWPGDKFLQGPMPCPLFEIVE